MKLFSPASRWPLVPLLAAALSACDGAEIVGPAAVVPDVDAAHARLAAVQADPFFGALVPQLGAPDAARVRAVLTWSSAWSDHLAELALGPVEGGGEAAILLAVAHHMLDAAASEPDAPSRSLPTHIQNPDREIEP